jgi:hypothetical protein
MKQEESMIEPSNGRVVLFTPYRGNDSAPKIPADPMAHHDKAKPLAAIIVHVWHDRMVNLIVFDSNGITHPRTSVPLLQDDDQEPSHGYYAEWMTYQKGQAAKTEAVQALLQVQ